MSPGEDSVKVDIYTAQDGDLTLYTRSGQKPYQVLSGADRERFQSFQPRGGAEVSELEMDDAARAALEQAVAAKGYHIAGGGVAEPHSAPPNFIPQT
jgi:hypothetical protein